MKQSSLLIQKIANDAGIPYSKAEKVLNLMRTLDDAYMDAVNTPCPPGDPTDATDLHGQTDGMRAVLVLLGASTNMINACINEEEE